MIEVKILKNTLHVEEVYSKALGDGTGAVNMFIGTVRNKTGSRNVIRLEYEAYKPMAVSEMKKIARQAEEKWPIGNVVIHHRQGILKIGDSAVIIAVSTPHRKESFEACRFIIDTLKQKVPIWKKEIFEGGEEWVSAHP